MSDNHSINTPPSYLVTLTVIGHGSTIDVSIDESKKNIFGNTVLYSVAPQGEDMCRHIMNTPQITTPVFKAFNTNFADTDNINIIKQYRDVDNAGKDPITNMYNILETITYDKVFSFEKSTYMNYFTRSPSCILLSTVHTHEGDQYVINKELSNKYDLLRDLNTIIMLLHNNSNSGLYEKIMDEAIDFNSSKYSSMTREEKKAFFRDFNFEISNGFIQQIKMSSLVKYIKLIFGKNTAINIIDFTCNGPASFLKPSVGGRKTRKYRGGAHRKTRNKNRGIM